jgi:N-hydroxyarylamine O-acetyltransferase
MPICTVKYFRRISYTGNRVMCPQTLKQLHRHHVLAIPFENLDVHLGRPILLDEDSLYKKIVLGNRGGYCYEMNGLFAIYLQQLGFKVNYLLARIWYNVLKDRPIARTHMLLKVNFPNLSWICDVGFGGNGLLEPIPLRLGQYTQMIDGNVFGTFQLESKKPGNYLLSTKIGTDWNSLYEFTLEECLPIDFQPLNYFQSHSPDAVFTKKLFYTIPTAMGRVTLDDLTLKTRKGNVTEKNKILNIDEYQATLEKDFNIRINKSDLSKLMIWK